MARKKHTGNRSVDRAGTSNPGQFDSGPGSTAQAAEAPMSDTLLTRLADPATKSLEARVRLYNDTADLVDRLPSSEGIIDLSGGGCSGDPTNWQTLAPNEGSALAAIIEATKETGELFTEPADGMGHWEAEGLHDLDEMMRVSGVADRAGRIGDHWRLTVSNQLRYLAETAWIA